MGVGKIQVGTDVEYLPALADACLGGRMLPIEPGDYVCRARPAGRTTRLGVLIPNDVHLILITDAGFGIPLFRAVSAIGWY